ncbi:MAG: MBL fold metallo-hydrolase [Cyanobacteria bacterium P01_A01_bin.105]
MTVSPLLTWLDVNSWKLDLDGLTVLIDPWLTGDLVFGNAPWLIRGLRPAPVSMPEQIDLIVLSQGLADHAHPETLQRLDKSIPVVASASGAAVARDLGFECVRALPPGESYVLADQLTVTALPGAPLGPLVTENAYVMTVLTTGHAIYYEPHGYPSQQLEALPDVDVAITPIVSLKLPLAGAVIRGGEGAIEVAKLTHPQVILQTAEGGDVTYTGLLSSLLRQTGGADALRSQLAAADLQTQVTPLRPMQSLPLDFAPRHPRPA